MGQPKPTSTVRLAQDRVAELTAAHAAAEEDHRRTATAAGQTPEEIEANLTAIRTAGSLP